MHLYAKALNNGGELIMSGFYVEDLESIRDRAAELGLQFMRFTENNNWVAALFTLK